MSQEQMHAGQSASEPRLISDSDPAYRELEERQRRFLSSTPFRAAEFPIFDQIRSSLDCLYADNAFEFSGGTANTERMKQALEFEFSKPFPTRYEALEYYVLLIWEDLLIRNFLATTDPRSDLRLTQTPLLGTVPSPSLNAHTIRTSGSSKLMIALNWGVYEVLTNMTELALQTVKVEFDPDGKTFSIFSDDEAFRTQLRARPQLKDNLIHLLLFYYGHEKVDPRPTQPSPVLFSFGSITRAMQLFVLAHEYGHILADHEKLKAMNSSGEGSETLVRSWAQELEADLIGFRLISYVLKRAAIEVPRQKVLLGFHLVAPLLYFECVRIVEEAEHIIQHRGEMPSRPSLLEISEAERTFDYAMKSIGSVAWKEPSAVTAFSRYRQHPPGWLRWELASKFLEREFPGLQESMQPGFTGTGVALGKNLHALWDEALPDFVRLVKEHAR